MAVNDPSTNFAWALPDVGGDTDVWDDDATEGLNTLFNAIDTDVKAAADDLDVQEAAISDLDTRIVSLESAQMLPVYARVGLVTKPAIPSGTPTTLGWSEEVDAQGLFSPEQPTRITIPDGSTGPLSFGGRFNLSGLYNLRAQVHVPIWTGDDNGRSWLVEIRKNGTTTIAQGRWPSLNDDVQNAGDELTLLVETMDVGAVGDYYEVRLTTNSGISAGVIRSSSFDAYRLPSPRTAVSRLIYLAGLDVHGNDAVDFDRYTNVTNELVWEAANGKFSGGDLKIRFDAIGRSSVRSQVLETQAAGGWAALYYSPNTSSASDQEPLRIMDGSAVRFWLECDSGGVIQLKNGDGTLLASGSNALGAGYAHVEVQWLLSTTSTGFCKVWVDGVLEIDESSINLGNGAATWDTWGVRSSASFNREHQWDDLVIQTSLGTRLGDGHRIWTARPDSDAGTNEWAVSSGTDHYAMVDDTDPDQTSTRLTSESASQREEFGFTLPAITGTIRDVIVKALVDPDSDEAIHLGLKVDGTDVLSGELFAPIGGVSEFGEFGFSIAGPPQGGEWTTAILEDAVILLESTENNTSCVATQVWLEVLTTA